MYVHFIYHFLHNVCIIIKLIRINDVSGHSEKKNAQQDEQTKADPQFGSCNPNTVHAVVVLKECRVHLLKLA